MRGTVQGPEAKRGNLFRLPEKTFPVNNLAGVWPSPKVLCNVLLRDVQLFHSMSPR